jgi:hypothetical protein
MAANGLPDEKFDESHMFQLSLAVAQVNDGAKR